MRRRHLSSPHGVRRFGIHERGAVAAPRGGRIDDVAAGGHDDTTPDGDPGERVNGAVRRPGRRTD